jgi:hypothetical protein
MAENVAIFDFEPTAEQMTAVDGLDKSAAGRVGPNPDTFDLVPSAETPTRLCGQRHLPQGAACATR